MVDRERKLQNNLLLRQHHQYQIDHNYTPYLETHNTVNELIERFSSPFDYTLVFIATSITHTFSRTTGSITKEYKNTSVQTDKEELISSLSVATYLNIRKRLDELQHPQKLENQRSVGINTDLVKIDVNSQFDETAWLNPHKTPVWADYETQSEPSLESVELVVLRDLYKSDNTSSETEIITATELTAESPPTFTETDMSPQPRCCKCRYQPDSKETPRRSLRIKTTHQSKQN